MNFAVIALFGLAVCGLYWLISSIAARYDPKKNYTMKALVMVIKDDDNNMDVKGKFEQYSYVYLVSYAIYKSGHLDNYEVGFECHNEKPDGEFYNPDNLKLVKK